MIMCYCRKNSKERVTSVIRYFYAKKVENMAGQAFTIEIDASDLQNEIERLRAVCTQERFNQVMYSIFNRTGGHVRMILRKDLPKQYHAKAGDISRSVGGARVSSGGVGGVGCTIPIRDHRGSVGGRYKASGGAHGWNSLHRKYKVKARVVKAGASVLPAHMPGSYGGNPPFRNLGSKLGGVAFTRKTKERFPIMKVESMAIPQMPMNRSEPDVQNDIKTYMQQRMEHEFQRLIAGGR